MRTRLALALLLAAATARAKYMEHHDLASLVAESESVVLAEEVARRPPDGKPWEQTITYKVAKVYRGAIAVGGTLEVDWGAYVTELPPDECGQPRVAEKTVMLFVAPYRPWNTTHTANWLVPSGMRLIARGRVWRFEQWSNPGPYQPVPHGADPVDGAGADDHQRTLPELEAQLARAIARVERIQAARRIADPAARARALLAEMPPPRRLPAAERRGLGFFADALDRQLQGEVIATGDFDAGLAAMARDVDGLFFSFRPQVPAELDARWRTFVRAAAADARRPLAERDAAVRLLGEGPPRDQPESRDDEALIAGLLDDGVPLVRVAAADVLAERAGWTPDAPGHKRGIRARLERALARERDATARAALTRGLERVRGR